MKHTKESFEGQVTCQHNTLTWLDGSFGTFFLNKKATRVRWWCCRATNPVEVPQDFDASNKVEVRQRALKTRVAGPGEHA